jgi:predicted transcriptional regulator
MYKIGEDIGLVDKIQTDHIVEILLKDGYIINGKENSKIKLTDEGYKRLRNISLE